MRIMLDTNVLYAVLRSPQGASRFILELIVDQKLIMVLTLALFLESVSWSSRPGNSWHNLGAQHEKDNDPLR
jgi:predicted nucleic acid-binding protein